MANRILGDYGQTLRITVGGISLAGNPTIAIIITKPVSNTVLSKTPATVDTVLGILTYVFASGDLDELGAYQVQVQVTQSGNPTRTGIGSFTVCPAL